MAPHRITEPFFRRLFLAAFVPLVALVFLLGAGAAQAVPMVQFDDPSDLTKATGILNLDVPGGDPRGYNVVFDQQAFANQIYGPNPASPDDPARLPPFLTLESTSAAADAVNAALNDQGA